MAKRNGGCQSRSGCMSVAGCGTRIPSSFDVSCVGFAAREWVRARGSDGSPRNVLMVSDGRALGMEVEMDGGLQVSESPLAP